MDLVEHDEVREAVTPLEVNVVAPLVVELFKLAVRLVERTFVRSGAEQVPFSIA